MIHIISRLISQINLLVSGTDMFCTSVSSVIIGAMKAPSHQQTEKKKNPTTQINPFPNEILELTLY